MNVLKVKKDSPKTIYYIIPGEPLHYYKTYKKNDREWSPLKNSYVSHLISFENQQKDLHISGLVALDLKFYLNPQKSANLVNLVRFVEDLFSQSEFTRDCKIVEISAKKLYSNETKTEITVKKL